MGNLTGSVTVSGEPLGDCLVVLFNQEKHVAMTSRVDSEGNYSVKDLLIGHYQVAVRQQPQNFPTGEDFQLSVEVLNKIPPKYRTLEKSGLSVEISEGDNELPLPL